MSQHRLKLINSVVLLVVVFALTVSKPLAQAGDGTLAVASTEELTSLNPISDPQASALMPLFLGTLLEVNPQSKRLSIN